MLKNIYPVLPNLQFGSHKSRIFNSVSHVPCPAHSLRPELDSESSAILCPALSFLASQAAESSGGLDPHLTKRDFSLRYL